MLQFLLLGAVLVAVWTVLALLADRFLAGGGIHAPVPAEALMARSVFTSTTMQDMGPAPSC